MATSGRTQPPLSSYASRPSRRQWGREAPLCACTPSTAPPSTAWSGCDPSAMEAAEGGEGRGHGHGFWYAVPVCCASLGLAGISRGLVSPRALPWLLPGYHLTSVTLQDAPPGGACPPALLRVLCQHPSTPSRKMKGPLATHARRYSRSTTHRPSAPATEV